MIYTFPKIYLITVLLLFFMSFSLVAQNDSIPEEEIDFSAFAGEAEMASGTKSYCTSKIIGISPSKLISVGYDIQGPYSLTTDVNNTAPWNDDISISHGLRLGATFPVVSNIRGIFSIGFSYWEQNYSFKNTLSGSPLAYSLDNSALRTTGVNFTYFKPLSGVHFLLFNSSHDLNGDYRLNEWQNPKYIKHSVLGVFGWKKHDRRQFGIGVARTYRVGEVNYIPIILYNYTSPNGKWGIESILPARFHYRRTINARNLLFAGFELEGNSYRLRNRDNVFAGFPNDALELRRSELRLRLVYERSLYGFIWLSAQVGYRYNYRFEVDNGEFFRGFFGDQQYVFENKLTNPIYFNIGLNLVSP